MYLNLNSVWIKFSNHVCILFSFWYIFEIMHEHFNWFERVMYLLVFRWTTQNFPNKFVVMTQEICKTNKNINYDEWFDVTRATFKMRYISFKIYIQVTSQTLCWPNFAYSISIWVLQRFLFFGKLKMKNAFRLQ